MSPSGVGVMASAGCFVQQSLFDAFLKDRGVDGPIYFVRSGQWIMGYAAAKFADEIWSEDALE